HTERHRKEPERAFAAPRDEIDRALDDEPHVRRRLTERERAREMGDGSLADIDRDHLLVEPEHPSVGPLDDQKEGAGCGDRERDSAAARSRRWRGLAHDAHRSFPWRSP